MTYWLRLLLILSLSTQVFAKEPETPARHHRVDHDQPAVQQDVPAVGISAVPPAPPQPVDPNQKPQTRKEWDPQPLPEAHRVLSPMESVVEAYPHMWVSFQMPTAITGYLTTGADLIRENLDIFENGIQQGISEGVKPQNLSVRYDRYEIGDPRVVDRHLKFVNQYKVGEDLIITDGNVLADREFSKDEKSYYSDFSDIKHLLKKSPEAEALKRLMDEGKFIVCGSHEKYTELKEKTKGQKKFIILLGLYDKNRVKETPIAHQKDGLVAEKDDAGNYKRGIVGVKSTCNDTLPPNAKFDNQGNVTTFSRYNRMVEVREPNLLHYMYDHFEALAEALGDGLEIKDTKSPVPPEVVFKNGEVIRAFHTDGQFNPNDEQNRLMTMAVQQPNDVQITGMISNQFVNTYKPGLQSLRALKAKFPDFKYEGLFDMHFADPFGFGFTPALGGFAVFRPMGGAIYPFGYQTRQGFDINVYMRGIDGVAITEEEGAPTNVALDHDKTNVFFTKINGKEYTAVFFGSLNYSGHFANAEYQDQVYALPDSKFAQATVESIRQFIKIEKAAGNAWPVKEAVARLALANFTGHASLEVDRATVDNLIKIVEDKNLNEEKMKQIHEIILTLAQKPTSLGKKPDLALIQGRLSKMHDFLTWYLGKYPVQYGLSTQILVDIVMPLIHEKMPAVQKAFAIKLMIFDSKLSKDQLEAKAKEVWEEMRSLGYLDGDYPTMDNHDKGPPEEAHKKPLNGKEFGKGHGGPAEAGAGAARAATVQPDSAQVSSATGTQKTAASAATVAPAPTPVAATEPHPPIRADSVVTQFVRGIPKQTDPPVANGAAAVKPTAHATVEDFDDNFIVTRAKVLVRNKTTPSQIVKVSTAHWATVKTQLGKPGRWQDFETFDGSFADFEAGKIFKLLPVTQKDGKPHLEISDEIKGPSWEAALDQCSTQAGANLFFFNTARETPDDIDRILDMLIDAGVLRFRPPKENILFGADTPQKKFANFRKVLAKVNAIPITPDMQKVLTPDGKAHLPLNLIGFSDDDWGNASAIISSMTESERHSEFQNVKVTVFYTGSQIYPDQPVHKVPRQALIPTSSGTRAQVPEEIEEYSTTVRSSVDPNCITTLQVPPEHQRRPRARASAR